MSERGRFRAIVVSGALVACGSTYSAIDAAVTAEAGADAAHVEASTQPDGSVVCGSGSSTMWCDPTTQYCQETGFTSAEPLSAKCVEIPSRCLGERTCACLVDAGVACDYMLEDSGILLAGCFEP